MLGKEEGALGGTGSFTGSQYGTLQKYTDQDGIFAQQMDSGKTPSVPQLPHGIIVRVLQCECSSKRPETKSSESKPPTTPSPDEFNCQMCHHKAQRFNLTKAEMADTQKC